MTVTVPTDRARSAAPVRWQPAGARAQFAVLTGRSLRGLVADRRLVVLTLVQPLILLVIFSQVFGSMASPDHFPAGVSYIDYLMPAILVTSGITSAVGSGAELIRDMDNGVLTRFRSLPVGLHWILVARAVTDVLRTAAQTVLLLVCAALCFGFDPAGGLPGVLVALVLSLLVIASLTWVFIAVGTWVRSARIMQSVSGLALFPLMFASSAYVPLDALPAWLRAVAVVNPVSYAVDATRALALDWPLGGEVLGAVATSLLIMALAVWAAVAGFRRPLSR
ncbi:ABC transporter permease [Streptomyces tauricus]|uniref:ABC transporter permease n=1 Tax=Streptomyces tauricus TaxID=68274 RepID=UPI002243368D|nr:ABC transporter permease [Streptomyces tauricus]MCW8102742.1 ABC transporter permease [Streptomyces tauricus]